MKKLYRRVKTYWIEELIEAYPIKGRRVPLSHSHPHVAAYWYYKKNCGFGPEDFSYGSHMKVWWFCDKSPDHIFQTGIGHRVSCDSSPFQGCPFCAGLKPSRTNWLHSHRQIAKEFHPTKNGKLTPKTVVAGSERPCYWHCSKCGHSYKLAPAKRVRQGQGCPKCNPRERADLRKYHAVMKMFDIKKNKGIDYKNVGSLDRIWWRCPKAKEHIFKAGFYKANRPTPQCPFCANLRASSTNNLTMNKRLAKEFHPTKNGSIKPRDLTQGCHVKIWWKCKKGPDHEWQAEVYSRNQGTNCPFCSHFRLSVTNVLSAYSHVARDFHPTKNGDLTPETMLATSVKKVFWLCSVCGLEWKMSPYWRVVEGVGCRECKRAKKGSGFLSTRQKDEIKKFLRKGTPVAQIAKKMGVHIMTVYRTRDAMLGA